LNEKKIYVIDTSVVLIGYIPQAVGEGFFTVPEVFDEIKNNEQLKFILEKAVESNTVIIKNPSERAVKTVITTATETGDINKLSQTDIKLLALCIDLKTKYTVVLITDDYAIQNTGKKMGLSVKSLKQKGIRKIIFWEKYCPACFKTYNNENKICDICGTKLKIKPKNKKEVD